MNVRISPARAKARPTAVAAQKTQQSFSWPAPTRGLVANGNIAVSQSGAAYILDNFRCTATGVTIRRGKQKYATLPAGAKSIFSYLAGSVRKLFAATDENIYDITTIVSPTDPGSVALANTNGKWITVQTESSDGSTYIRGVNGTDTPFIYDGTSFGTTPALTFPTGSTVTADKLSYAWVYKNRSFFTEKGTLNCWYLPVGQIGGELTLFSLGGQFKLGGSLIMGATWSRDTGSGLAAVCAFFSSEGEVAIYEGDNPGDTSSWQIVGVYRIGKPLGPKSIMDAGGDLIIATDIGLVPLSRALAVDYSILGTEAISESIIDLWNQEVTYRTGGEWNVAFWSAKQMVAIALPTINDQPVRWLVTNAKTKGWSTYSGWDASCLHVFGDQAYFGDKTGAIFEAEVSGFDDGLPYSATCLPAFDQMGVAGYKTISMLRAVWRGPYPVDEKITVKSDYDETVPASPSAVAVPAGSIWGTAEWGDAKWVAAGVEKSVYQQWRVSYGGGEVHSPMVQLTSGSNAPLDAELIRVDAMFTTGDPVM